MLFSLFGGGCGYKNIVDNLVKFYYSVDFYFSFSRFELCMLSFLYLVFLPYFRELLIWVPLFVFFCCDIDRFVVAYLERCAPYGLNNREKVVKRCRDRERVFLIMKLARSTELHLRLYLSNNKPFLFSSRVPYFSHLRHTWPNAGSTVLFSLVFCACAFLSSLVKLYNSNTTTKSPH